MTPLDIELAARRRQKELLESISGMLDKKFEEAGLIKPKKETKKIDTKKKG